MLQIKSDLCFYIFIVERGFHGIWELTARGVSLRMALQDRASRPRHPGAHLLLPHSSTARSGALTFGGCLSGITSLN